MSRWLPYAAAAAVVLWFVTRSKAAAPSTKAPPLPGQPIDPRVSAGLTSGVGDQLGADIVTGRSVAGPGAGTAAFAADLETQALGTLAAVQGAYKQLTSGVGKPGVGNPDPAQIAGLADSITQATLAYAAAHELTQPPGLLLGAQPLPQQPLTTLPPNPTGAAGNGGIFGGLMPDFSMFPDFSILGPVGNTSVPTATGSGN